MSEASDHCETTGTATVLSGRAINSLLSDASTLLYRRVSSITHGQSGENDSTVMADDGAGLAAAISANYRIAYWALVIHGGCPLPAGPA